MPNGGVSFTRSKMISIPVKTSLALAVVMTLAMRVTAQSPPVNLWPNPTLEADSNGDGTPDFWSKGGGSRTSVPLDIWDTSNFVSSSHSLAVMDDSATKYGGWFSDFVFVMPGEHYVLSFKRRYCASQDGMRVSANYISSSNTFVSNVSFPVSGCQLTWEQVTAELTIPSGVTKLSLEIVSGGATEIIGTNWIDDISLTTNPMFCEGQFSYRFTTEKLWDFSGVYFVDETIGMGRETLRLELVHTPQGKISGQRSETATNEILGTAGTMQINGRTKSTSKGVQLGYRYVDNNVGTYYGFPASFRGPLHFVYYLDGRVLNGEVSGTDCLTYNNTRECLRGRILDAETWPVKENMTGEWVLCLDVTESARRFQGNASARLSNGREMLFTVTGTRRPSGIGSLVLRGTSDAAGITLRVTVDQSMNLKTARGKLFGQTVRAVR